MTSKETLCTIYKSKVESIVSFSSWKYRGKIKKRNVFSLVFFASLQKGASPQRQAASPFNPSS